MTDELEVRREGDSENLTEKLKLIVEGYEAACLAFQTQDRGRLDKELMLVRNRFRALGRNWPDSEEALCGQFFCTLAETFAAIMKGTHLQVEGRLHDALSVLRASRNGLGRLSESLADHEFADDELSELMSGTSLLTMFFDKVIVSVELPIEAEVRREGGEVVDQLKVLENVRSSLLEVANAPWSDREEDLAVGLGSFATRLAELYGRQVQSLRMKREQVEFIKPHSKTVFLVHGHDPAILSELRKMLEDDLELDVCVLSERPDRGLTIMEKFERHGSDSGFAFVIVTPDDVVSKSGTEYWQCRPNVLYELGWFCGRFGRDRVRILKKRGTSLPSDLQGVLYIEFIDRVEEVYRKIKEDLELAGIHAEPHA